MKTNYEIRYAEHPDDVKNDEPKLLGMTVTTISAAMIVDMILFHCLFILNIFQSSFENNIFVYKKRTSVKAPYLEESLSSLRHYDHRPCYIQFFAIKNLHIAVEATIDFY